jgi:hypothetical protein
MKKSELKALILECKQELSEEGSFKGDTEDVRPPIEALVDAFAELNKFVALHDLENDIATFPFGSLDEASMAISDWAAEILK